jgi:hypothetical protein
MNDLDPDNGEILKSLCLKMVEQKRLKACIKKINRYLSGNEKRDPNIKRDLL